MPKSVVPAWADIQPKVTASALAYAWAVAVLSLLTNEFGVEVSAVTGQALSGAVMLLAGYLMPNGRHDARTARPANDAGYTGLQLLIGAAAVCVIVAFVLLVLAPRI